MLVFLMILLVAVFICSIVYNIMLTKEINKLEDEYLSVLKELNDLKEENERLKEKVYRRERDKRMSVCKNDNVVENTIDKIDPIQCRKELYVRKILSEAQETTDFYNILIENIIDIDGFFCAINKSNLALLMKEYNKFSHEKLDGCYMDINGKCYLTNKGINYVTSFSRLLLYKNDIVSNMLIFAVQVPVNDQQLQSVESAS